MVRRNYFGVIERGNHGFGIYFPDFPGCVSGGDTLDQVVAMGNEALQFHIEGMVEDGDPLPAATDVDLERERLETPEANLHALVAISVAIPTFPEMIDVPMQSKIVREIAEEVQRNIATMKGMSARQFIENAARRALDRLKQSA